MTAGVDVYFFEEQDDDALSAVERAFEEHGYELDKDLGYDLGPKKHAFGDGYHYQIVEIGSNDDYEPELTTDDMNGGQWYESLNEDYISDQYKGPGIYNLYFDVISYDIDGNEVYEDEAWEGIRISSEEELRSYINIINSHSEGRYVYNYEYCEKISELDEGNDSEKSFLTDSLKESVEPVKPTEEEFQAYCVIQYSGITNMFDINTVMEAAEYELGISLTKEKIFYIFEHYQELMDEYGFNEDMWDNEIYTVRDAYGMNTEDDDYYESLTEELKYDDIQYMSNSERHDLFKKYHNGIDFEDFDDFWNWAEEEFPMKDMGDEDESLNEDNKLKEYTVSFKVGPFRYDATDYDIVKAKSEEDAIRLATKHVTKDGIWNRDGHRYNFGPNKNANDFKIYHPFIPEKNESLDEQNCKWAVVDDYSGDIIDVFDTKERAKSSAAETQELHDDGMYISYRGPFVVEPYYGDEVDESLNESLSTDWWNNSKNRKAAEKVVLKEYSNHVEPKEANQISVNAKSDEIDVDIPSNILSGLSEWVDRKVCEKLNAFFDKHSVNIKAREKSYANYIWFELDFGEDNKEVISEDTVKQNGKWVNKGKEGTHGKFKTKKEADAQRKAMFANGFHESLDNDVFNYNGVDIKVKNGKFYLKSPVNNTQRIFPTIELAKKYVDNATDIDFRASRMGD